MRDHGEGSWPIDLYRLIPSNCSLEKPFIHCDRVVPQDILGEQNPFYIDGQLAFPSGFQKNDGCYKTIFGPVVYNTGIILARNDQNQRGGLSRLTGIREPLLNGIPNPQYHYWLCDNQRQFYETNDLFHNIVKSINKEITQDMFHWLNHTESQLEDAALNPDHPKYKLRAKAWVNTIMGQNKWRHKTWVVENNGFVKINMKGREIAKPGKFIRVTYDLGTPASLAAGPMVERIKAVIAEMSDGEFGCSFTKSPDLDALTNCFENLINPKGDHYFCYFSDDSCISIKCDDGTFLANVDISTCDASHTRAVFDALRDMVKGNRELERLINKAIAQCEVDLIIRSTINPKHKVKFSVSEPILYTGSILTTLINNIANLMIFSSIITQLPPRRKVAECEQLIADASKLAGYLVTCTVCHKIQELQFLKHSPFYARSGKLVPVLNLGVIGRTIGSCWGDLPMYEKGMSIADRRSEYNRRQVSCFKRGARHSILENLIVKYNPGVEVNDHRINLIQGDQSNEFVDNDQIALRYGVSAEEISHLAELYLGEAVSIKTTASVAIMQLDYGLGIKPTK